MNVGFNDGTPAHAHDIERNGSKSALEVAREKTGEEAARHILDTGWFEAGGSYIFYVEWGNPNGIPFISLHGGPGASFGASHVALFDPEIHHVVFFDQRGCGASLPPADSLNRKDAEAAADTGNMLADTESLRQRFFGSKKVNVAGGSWGSTLALVYAIQNPDKVSSLQLWSTFLGSAGEVDDMFEGHLKRPDFPYHAEHEWFLRQIADNEPHYQYLKSLSGREMVRYLAEKTTDPDPAVARRHALAFEVYEYALCSPENYVFENLIAEESKNPNIVSHGRIEILSHLNAAYIDDGYITENIGRIRHIPCAIVQGERDWCTPEKYARQLQTVYGENCEVEVVKSGHLRSDPAMKEALQRNMRSKSKPR